MSCNVLIARIHDIQATPGSGVPRIMYQVTACGKKEVCGLNVHAMRYGTQPFQTTMSICEEHKAELKELKYDFFEKLRYTIKTGVMLGNITDEMVKKSTFGNHSMTFRSLWGIRELSNIRSYEFIDLKELSTKEKRIRDELKERFIVSMERKKHGFLTDDDYRQILEEAINVSNVRKVMNS